MYLLMRTGYAVSQSFAAAYVVFLLGMGGAEWHQTVRDRVLLTLLGGAAGDGRLPGVPGLGDSAAAGPARGLAHRERALRGGGGRQLRGSHRPAPQGRAPGAAGRPRGPDRVGGSLRAGQAGARTAPWRTDARGGPGGPGRAHGAGACGDAPGGASAGTRSAARPGGRGVRRIAPGGHRARGTGSAGVAGPGLGAGPRRLSTPGREPAPAWIRWCDAERSSCCGGCRI